MLAFTVNGKITECKAKVLGNGRCNHAMHQEENESILEFVHRVNQNISTESVSRYRKPIARTLTLEEKQQLSGRFRNCKPVSDEDIEELSNLLLEAKNTLHYERERQSRQNTVEKYEEDYSGKVQDMFIVDKGHSDGAELHVVKNNGIVEAYNINKLYNHDRSRTTKLFARPAQIKRYYKWCDWETPKYLVDIATENEAQGRNNM